MVELLRAQRELVGRYWHDVIVQIEDFTNEGFVASSLAVPGQPAQEAAADRQRRPGRRRHRLGRHHHDARRGRPPQLRLPVDGALAEPKVQGDLAAWFGSVPAVPAACEGPNCWGAKAARHGFETSTRSPSGRRPPRSAPAGDNCVPYTSGSMTTSPYSATCDPPRSGCRSPSGATPSAEPAAALLDVHRMPLVRHVLLAGLARGARGRRCRSDDQAGEFFTLLGPSARARPPAWDDRRLHAADVGRILIGGEDTRAAPMRGR